MKKQSQTSLFAHTKPVAELIDDLQPGLQIDENALNEECQRQSELFQVVGDALTFALSRRDEAKIILAEVEAAVDLEIRKKGRASKLTNPEISAMVCIDDRVRDAKRQHLRFVHEAARLSTLKESFEQRSYQLSQMTKLYLSSYFGDVSGTSSTSQIKVARAEHIKGELDRMRRGR